MRSNLQTCHYGYRSRRFLSSSIKRSAKTVKPRVIEALKGAIEMCVMLFWFPPFVALWSYDPRIALEWMVGALVSPAGAVLLLCIVAVVVTVEMRKRKVMKDVDSAGGAIGLKPSRGQSARNIILSVSALCVLLLPNYAIVAFLWSFPEALLDAAFWRSYPPFFVGFFVFGILFRTGQHGLIFRRRAWHFGHPPRSSR